METESTYREAIAAALWEIMIENPNAVVMGQGVGDPTAIYGTTRGLIGEFGAARVIDMPIMEEGMTGIGIGMALNGLYPIQTHIRVDFLILAMNQIINIAAKYRYMYGGAFNVPMLIRAVVGRSWGQGPQHSQSLQALFGHIPGLTVLMPSTAEDAYYSYLFASRGFPSVVLSIEHRLLFDLTFQSGNNDSRRESPFQMRKVREGKDVTVVAISYMVQEAQRAADWLQDKFDIGIEIIDPHIVSDIDHSEIIRSVEKTGRLLVADTGWQAYGVCAEISRGLMQVNPRALTQPVKNLAMQASPCPTTHSLEGAYYPDMSDIVKAVLELTNITDYSGTTLPTKEDARRFGQLFRGPF